MTLTERVHVARRYQRAIRIDTDFGDLAALEGFVCPQSSAEVLEAMARHALQNRSGRVYLDRTLWGWQVEPGGCPGRYAERQGRSVPRSAHHCGRKRSRRFFLRPFRCETAVGKCCPWQGDAIILPR